MANYNVKLNLLNLNDAGVADMKGPNGIKRCVVIPVDENYIYLSKDNSDDVKAAYLHLVAFENKEQGRYCDTHGVKLEYPKEVRKRMRENNESTPFIGNIKPIESDAKIGDDIKYTQVEQSESKQTSASEQSYSNNYDEVPF